MIDDCSRQVKPFFKDFPTYNREWERHQLKLQEKELRWEAELKQLMDESTISPGLPIPSTEENDGNDPR